MLSIVAMAVVAVFPPERAVFIKDRKSGTYR